MLVERMANMADNSFMNSCILYGARKGHYAFDAENTEVVRAMKMEMQSVISNGLLADNRHATASVYTLQNSRVGVSIICEALPGSMAVEIYALSVANRFQRSGFGGQMLDHVLRNYLYHDVIARCLPLSETMKQLLIRRGFVLHRAEGDFETYIKHGFDCCDAVQPMVFRY